MLVRQLDGREASPSACVIDSQSVKTTEGGGPRGYDAGRKVKGRKRHILTDTPGLMLEAVVHAADIQDWDGGPVLLSRIRNRFPWLSHIFADGGYAGDQFAGKVADTGVWSIGIIKRSDTAKGFVPLPRRWVVERTFAWLGRNRRLTKNFERTIESSAAWLFPASVSYLSEEPQVVDIIPIGRSESDSERSQTSRTPLGVARRILATAWRVADDGF